MQINLFFSKKYCIFACFFGKNTRNGVPDANQAVGCLWWGRAETRVAFMPPSGIRCDRDVEGVGKLAEWSIAAVLKTVDLRGSGGSNPSLSARKFGNRWKMKKRKLTVFSFCFTAVHEKTLQGCPLQGFGITQQSLTFRTSPPYFPMQNRSKMVLSTSCELTCPVISPNASSASCKSSASSSPLSSCCSPSSTRCNACSARHKAS